MAKEILTRCGYRCDLCLAFKDNIETNDQREFLSDTWYKIYGFRIMAQEIYCEGCISSDNPKLIDKKCPVRPCVIEKGLENCSQCNDYPCELFNQRKVTNESFSKDKILSRKEYFKGIKPYENEKRFEEIRKNNNLYLRLLNSNIIPDYESMLKFIGNRQMKNAWLNLLAFIDNSYDLDKKILFGGKKYGWAVQYKRSKRTIVTLFPERESFTVLLVFGKLELKKIYTNKGLFSETVIDKIDNTKQYHDGKWVWFRCENEKLINDIIELIKIKRNPDR